MSSCLFIFEEEVFFSARRIELFQTTIFSEQWNWFNTMIINLFNVYHIFWMIHCSRVYDLCFLFDRKDLSMVLLINSDMTHNKIIFELYLNKKYIDWQKLLWIITILRTIASTTNDFFSIIRHENSVFFFILRLFTNIHFFRWCSVGYHIAHGQNYLVLQILVANKIHS